MSERILVANPGSSSITLRLLRETEVIASVVDPERNAKVRGDADISAADAGVWTVVIRAREDRTIAAGVRAALAVYSGGPS